MADVPAQTFLNFFLFLAIPFALAGFFRKNRISPLIGYMLGGMLLSNIFGSFVDRQAINNFAYLGIVLLMFTVGLETRFDSIINLKKFIVLGGSLQIGLSIIFLAMLSLLFHFSLVQAILISIALSSSSTTLVAKIIQDRGEEGSFHGEIAIGILIFQDLAFIPFMIIFTSLTGGNMTLSEIAVKMSVDLALSSLILLLAYYFGKKIVPVVFNRIASISRELLNLFIIVFIFFVGYLSSILHVPVLVSIFVAGIVIAQTMEHHHIFTQIRPLRDLLAIIFFIYIGTTVSAGAVLPALPSIILFSLGVIAVKALVILFVFLGLKFSSKMATYLSLYLFQIDEDAFILISLAYANRFFQTEEYLFLITSVMFSLILTPFLINNKENIYLRLRSVIKKYLPFLDKYLKYRIDFNPSPIDALNIRNHVIICGYGRVGSYIGRALMLANIPFIAIDYNFHIIEKAKRQGVNIIYGDPTDSDILDYAEVENAVCLVLAMPDRYSQEAVVLAAKKFNRDIVIISRVHQHEDHNRMKDLGVEAVIQPEFEASLSIIKKIFLLKRVDREEIMRKLQYFKVEQLG